MKKTASIFCATVMALTALVVSGCNKPDDKTAFENYKKEKCEYVESLSNENNSNEIALILMLGANDIKSVEWDEGKGLTENKQTIDAIVEGVQWKYDRELHGPVSFTYTFYGQTFDLGEKMYLAEINTGDVTVNANQVTKETFSVKVEHDVNGKISNTLYSPEGVSVEGNKISLMFGEKDVPNNSAPRLSDTHTEIDMSILGLGKTTEDYTVTPLLNQSIGYIEPKHIVFEEDCRVNEDVSIFEARTITSKSGVTVPYRIFEPTVADGEKAPLILWLNTSAETGTNNYSQVGTVPVWKLTTTEIQRIFGDNGAFVVATQVPDIVTTVTDEKWGNNTYKNLREAVDDAIAKADGKVDMNRIYVFGGSLGGMYTNSMVHHNPNFFAAAISCAPGSPILHVAGSDKEATREEQIAAVQAIADTGIAMYFVHSDKDPIADPENGIYSWKLMSELGGDATLAVCNNVYIEGDDGKDTKKAHETWLHVFNNFDGTEKDANKNNAAIWKIGNGTYQCKTYGTVNYVSTMPKNAKGDFSDILSWLAAHKLNYTITYYDGDTKITSFMKNSYKPNESFTLETPKKDGKTFIGWYDNPELTGNPVTGITKDKFDKTFYAKWE